MAKKNREVLAEKRRRRNGAIGSLITVLGFATNFVFASARFTTLLLAVAFFFFSGWIFTFGRLARIPSTYRYPCQVIIAGLLALGAWQLHFHAQYRAQQAALSSGVLIGPKHDGGPITLRVGRNGSTPITWMGDQEDAHFLSMFGESELRVHRIDGRLCVTTQVHDHLGHLVVEINDNHWNVTKESVDKNYTDNALEVRDADGRVVLHLMILKDEVQVEGEWSDDQGESIRFYQDPFDYRTESIQEPFSLRTIDPVITKWFKYPSAEHWGEMDNAWQKGIGRPFSSAKIAFNQSPFPYRPEFGLAKYDILVTIPPSEIPSAGGYVVVEFSDRGSWESDYSGNQDGAVGELLSEEAITSYLRECSTRCAYVRINPTYLVSPQSGLKLVFKSQKPVHVIKAVLFRKGT
jgi:hypothetical protein